MVRRKRSSRGPMANSSAARCRWTQPSDAPGSWKPRRGHTIFSEPERIDVESIGFRAELTIVSADSRRKLVLAAGGAVLAAASAAIPVHAGLGTGPFHCGSKIIYVGMLQSEVLQYCGEPTSKMVDNQRVRSANNQVLGYSRVERWKYESYSVTRRLVFVDEKLQAIE